jgi:hypothetical protein
MGTPPADRPAQGRAHGAAQPVELVLGQAAGGPARIDARLPQDLVGQQVADAGDQPPGPSVAP